jgi:WD40 repeat protein
LEQPELVVAEGGLHAVAPPAAPAAVGPAAAPAAAVPSFPAVPHRAADAGPAAAAAAGIRGLVRRRSARIGAAVAVLVLLAAGGAIAAIGGRDREPTSQPTRQPGYAHAGTLLTGRPACAAAWNPAGTRYAVTSADIGLEIYQRDGALLRTFPVQLTRSGTCYLNHPGVYWRPDGVTVAVVGGETYSEKLHLFNVETGDMTVARTGSEPVYDPPTWHPDSSSLLVHLGRRIVVAGPDGRPDRNLLPDGLETADHSVRSIGIAPAGDTFAVCWYDAGREDGPLFEIRRLADGSLVTSVGRGSESGEAELLAYHPAGTLVAVGINEFGVEVWETAGWSRVATLYGPTGVISDVRWSGNGEYLLATSHGHQKVHVFRTGDWQTVGELDPHEESRRKIGVYAGAVDNGGRVLLVPQGPRGIDVFDLS